MGDKLSLKCFFTNAVTTALCVFWYENTSGAGDSQDLFNSFGSDVAPKIVAVMSVAWHITRFEVANFNNPADFYAQDVIGYAGVEPAEVLPSWACFTYIYNRATRASRNGFKRIPGVSEVNQNDGIPIPAFRSTQLQALANGMGSVISFTGGIDYTPKIARVSYPVPNPLHLPPTAVTLFPISSVSFKHIGTQNSRKPY